MIWVDCWAGALRLAALGRPVKIMAGGITGWLDEGFALAQKYFGGIPARPTPAKGDFSEPLNTQEKRLQQSDALAQVPAIAVGWKMPDRGSADHAPVAVLSQILAGGDASRLYQGLVKGREQLLNLNLAERDIMADADFVLGRFSAAEREVINDYLLHDSIPLIEQFITNQISPTSLSIQK